jgi:hypothetical protein
MRPGLPSVRVNIRASLSLVMTDRCWDPRMLRVRSETCLIFREGKGIEYALLRIAVNTSCSSSRLLGIDLK